MFLSPFLSSKKSIPLLGSVPARIRRQGDTDKKIPRRFGKILARLSLAYITPFVKTYAAISFLHIKLYRRISYCYSRNWFIFHDGHAVVF
jgi:hypothetical protein